MCSFIMVTFFSLEVSFWYLYVFHIFAKDLGTLLNYHIHMYIEDLNDVLIGLY